MNERFVNIKVDREERPDVDAVYMDAVVALTGSGGWPMTVFLTPDGRAVPRRHVLPAGAAARAAELPPAARGVADAYRDQRDDVAQPGRGAARRDPRRRPRPRRRAEPLDRGAARTRPSAAARELSTRAGAASAARPSSRPPRRSSSCCAAARRSWPCATLDAMAAGGMYDLVGGGFHRYSVDERWLVPHFEKMLYDNALLVPAYLHGWLVPGTERYRAVVEETVEYMLRELRAARGRLRLGAGRRHRRRRGADVHVDARATACRRSCCSRSSTGASSCAASSTRRCGRGSCGCARRGRSRRATTRRSPPGTASRWRRWPRRGGGSTATTGSRRRAARRVPARPAVDARRAAAPHWRDGRGKGTGLPRRLRERRARPLRAARRDRRAALARGVAAARPARRRAVRATTSAAASSWRRPTASSSSRAEGPRRPPDPVRQLDARLRAPPAGADLRRRGAGAAGGRRAPARRATRCAAAPTRVRAGALRARPPPRRRRGSSRSSARRRARSRGRRSSRSTRTRSSRSARPRGCRCWRARTSSTASPRSTSASASPAAPVRHPVTESSRALDPAAPPYDPHSGPALGRARDEAVRRDRRGRRRHARRRRGRDRRGDRPNGAGKTTLFNLVTGLYRPDEGDLSFDGESLLRTPPHRVVRRGIARTSRTSSCSGP